MRVGTDPFPFTVIEVYPRLRHVGAYSIYQAAEAAVDARRTEATLAREDELVIIILQGDQPVTLLRTKNIADQSAAQAEAFEAIRGERRYQETRWSKETTSSAGRHSVTEFLVFLRSYVNEAMEHVSRNGEPGAGKHALGIVRKIAGLAVACMEQNGVVKR